MSSMIELFKYNYKDIASEITEIGVKDLLEDDSILKKMPIIGLVLSTKNTLSSINDVFLAQKMLKFLKLAGEISLEERVIFISKYLVGKEKKFAGKVIHTITKLDDVDKSKFIAKLYKSAVYEIITLEEFYRFIVLIDKIYINDLHFLLNNDKTEFKGLTPYLLSLLGVTEDNARGYAVDPCSIYDMTFKLTPFGEKIVNCLNN